MIKIRTYFSIQHLKSAYLLAEESQKIERTDISNAGAFDNLNSKNTAFVAGSLFATVSFLEATIREVISDIIDGRERANYLSSDIKNSIKSEWIKGSRDSLEKISILKKYQRVLELISETKIDTNSDVYCRRSFSLSGKERFFLALPVGCMS